MKNFDEARRARQATLDDRTFVLGDETFVLRAAIRPEALTPYDDLTSETSAVATLRILDDLIVAMIEPHDDADGRYRRVREQEDDPVEMADIIDIVQWATEVFTGRPTGRPSDSGSGPASTGTPSTDASSLQAIPVGSPV